MATGHTITDALTDAIDTVLMSARIVREYGGVMPQLCERQRIPQGRDWSEFAWNKLTARAVAEDQEFNNAQRLSGSKISFTPTTVVIYTVITDDVARTISKRAYAELGTLAQNAMQRKKDQDGLAALDSATTSLCGAGSTLSFGHISAAAVRITSNATEPGYGPLFGVLHGYQIKDIADEITAGIGTYIVPDGMSKNVFENGWKGKVNGVQIIEDGNITIDSADDAKGGVFCRPALLLIEQDVISKETERLIKTGSGATGVVLRDRYGFGERSAGNWLYEIYSDATTPTS